MRRPFSHTFAQGLVWDFFDPLCSTFFSWSSVQDLSAAQWRTLPAEWLPRDRVSSHKSDKRR